MSAASREMEAKVARTIFGAGGRLTEKGVDGAGHRTLTFKLNGHEARFHYASSPQANGCAPLNTITRLRRELKELLKRPPIVEASPEPEEAPQEALKHIAAPPARATPPCPKKAAQPTRRGIIKRYLSLRSLQAVAEELGLERSDVAQTILSSRGDAASFLRNELHALDAEAARRKRPRRKNPQLTDPKQRSKLALLAHRLYFQQGRTAPATARILKVSVTTAVKLAQEADV